MGVFSEGIRTVHLKLWKSQWRALTTAGFLPARCPDPPRLSNQSTTHRASSITDICVSNVLEAGRPRSGCPVRPLFLAWRRPPSHCVPTWWRASERALASLLLAQGHESRHGALPPWPHLNLITTKGPTSIYKSAVRMSAVCVSLSIPFPLYSDVRGYLLSALSLIILAVSDIQTAED